MSHEIDVFRTAHLNGRGKSHLMRVDSEYTLCGRSTATDEASVWEVSIPREPGCDRCRVKMLDSVERSLFSTERQVMVYEKVEGAPAFRGAFSVQISSSLQRKSEGWGMKQAAMYSRTIVDPGRVLEFFIDVLNPETLLYETFEFTRWYATPVTD